MANSVTDVFVGFRAACSLGSMASPDKSLQKCGKKICSYILHKKNCSDPNLGGSTLCIFTFFLFPYSGICLLNGFDFDLSLF